MIYLAFGSNMGNRLAHIYKGYDFVSEIGEIIRKSPIYESDAMLLPGDTEKQENYLNSVIAFKTGLSPHVLLFELKQIEKAVGARSTKRWGPRSLDIDILLYNDLVINDNELTIPHSGLTNRIFVLKPLYDVAGEIIIPPQNINIKTALENLDQSELRFHYPE